MHIKIDNYKVHYENVFTSSGCTPLHLASETHSCAVMRLLMEHGADVDSEDCDGRPPLHFAINSKMNGATEAMQLLVDHNADINMADANGNTALHLAAVSKKITRVNLLIRGGADVCMRNRAGKSALHFVMKHVPNSLRTVEERMDSGIRPDSVFESDTEKTTVKLNFNFLLPAKSRHPCVAVSEVGLFMEVLRLHNNDPAKLAR
jgi:ankyrin repeat protein